MSDTFEIEVTARDAQGNEATWQAEYTMPEGEGPQQAITDIVQSIGPVVGSRIRTVSHAD